MLRIGLFCASGMSTSILVKKIITAANNREIEVEVNAYPESEMVSLLGNIDIALLGPQVRFFLKKAEALCVDTPVKVAVINSVDYGMMNGEKILDQCLALAGK